MATKLVNQCLPGKSKRCNKQLTACGDCLETWCHRQIELMRNAYEPVYADAVKGTVNIVDRSV